jgi:hypothetical protein
MSFLYQVLMKFEIIIDLAIEDQPECTVFIGHRLAGIIRKINNCEPAVHKSRATTEMNPFPIRSPVCKLF